MNKDIKCSACATKTVARQKNDKIYVWCKQCKKEVELKVEKETLSHEPTIGNITEA